MDRASSTKLSVVNDEVMLRRLTYAVLSVSTLETTMSVGCFNSLYGWSWDPQQPVNLADRANTLDPTISIQYQTLMVHFEVTFCSGCRLNFWLCLGDELCLWDERSGNELNDLLQFLWVALKTLKRFR